MEKYNQKIVLVLLILFCIFVGGQNVFVLNSIFSTNMDHHKKMNSHYATTIYLNSSPLGDDSFTTFSDQIYFDILPETLDKINKMNKVEPFNCLPFLNYLDQQGTLATTTITVNGEVKYLESKNKEEVYLIAPYFPDDNMDINQEKVLITPSLAKEIGYTNNRKGNELIIDQVRVPSYMQREKAEITSNSIGDSVTSNSIYYERKTISLSVDDVLKENYLVGAYQTNKIIYVPYAMMDTIILENQKKDLKENELPYTNSIYRFHSTTPFEDLKKSYKETDASLKLTQLYPQLDVRLKSYNEVNQTNFILSVISLIVIVGVNVYYFYSLRKRGLINFQYLLCYQSLWLLPVSLYFIFLAKGLSIIGLSILFLMYIIQLCFGLVIIKWIRKEDI